MTKKMTENNIYAIIFLTLVVFCSVSVLTAIDFNASSPTKKSSIS